MASTSVTWRSLGLNALRVILSSSQNRVSLRQKMVMLPHLLGDIGARLGPVVKMSYAFSFALLSKEKLLNVPPPQNLTHEYLLTQASNSASVSSQQLLTLTVAAIVDVAEQYRQCMEKLMSLMEDTLEITGNCPSQDSIWDEVVTMRMKVEEMKKRLQDLSSFMEYVDKVATGSAEVSYFAGVEHVSTSMCNMINAAHDKIKEEYEKTKLSEQEFLNAQKHFIQKACEIEKHLKQRECEIREQRKQYYAQQLPKEDECRA